jgi:hypothetical protein
MSLLPLDSTKRLLKRHLAELGKSSSYLKETYFPQLITNSQIYIVYWNSYAV